MDHQDIRTLKILEGLDNDHTPSQRDLARELNISLGLVNSFIKRLVSKGFFKITNIPANRVKYILTPKGAAEKTRLTYEYIKYSYQFYKDARQRLRTLMEELEAQKVKGVIFYGVNELAEIAFVSLQETSIQLVAVIDAEKKGGKFLGNRIKEPAELKQLDYDRVIITDVESRDRLLEEVLAEGISPERVVMF